jgi:SnoaL-like domain
MSATASAAELLAAVEASPRAVAAHERDAWVGLFAPAARVCDPVGSRPHTGRAAIERFYDTFIGPREITFHPDVDIVVGTTVVRDLDIEVRMASTLTLRVPTYIRYDVEGDHDEAKIAALSAFWELPAMVGQFLRSGIRAAPAGLQLAKDLMTNQGFTGTLDYLGGLQGTGIGGKRLFTRFLDAACAGDEVGMRRRLASEIRISSGDDVQLSAGDLRKHLSGARWRKMIASGRFVVVAIERAGQRSVLFGEVGSESGVITRIRVFSEAAPTG